MKSVFIIFNQANTESVEYMLDTLKISGFTFFEQVQGRGRVQDRCLPESVLQHPEMHR